MTIPSLASLFTGTGGLDIGLEQAGFRTLFANDVESHACESLRANTTLASIAPDQLDTWLADRIEAQRCYRNIKRADYDRLRQRLLPACSARAHLTAAHILERDVRSVTGSAILEATKLKRGEVDLVAGGPPCQPFSRAGRRELVDCDTGQLFLEFVRIVDEVRPRWFLFENVKGLVIHHADVVSRTCAFCHHTTLVDFAERADLRDATDVHDFCAGCGQVGRQKVVWTKRRAGSLEVIQHEFERLGYTCSATVLNAADFGAPQQRERLLLVGSRDRELFSWPAPTHARISTDARVLDLFGDHGFYRARQRTLNEVLYPNGHWRYGPLDPNRAVLWVKNVVRPHDEPVTWSLDRPAPTIGAHQAAKLAIAPFGVPEEQLRRQQWHVLGRRQGDTPPVDVEHEYLTDEELLTLQTFPRSWYLHGTRMERAFQIGNAVPPALGAAVGQALLAAMGYRASAGREITHEHRNAARI